MILRRIKEVETIDVGKAFGMPNGTMLIQWIISNKIGDDRYRHRFALRKYTMKPVDPSTIPPHSHKYIQCLTVLSGRLLCETQDGQIEIGPWESVYFYENEPHKVVPIGNETVELFCIIDCPNGGENCLPEVPKNIGIE